jgi:predicted small secreted protein
MKRLLGWLLAACLLAMASGCETVKGVGRDVEKAGKTIQRTAD